MTVGNKKSISRIIVFLLLLLLAITTLFPFFYMIVTTFKQKPEYMKNIFSLPKAINFNNYKIIWENYDIIKLNMNSFKVTSLSVVTSIFITSMAGFSISKIKFKGKAILFGLIGFCMIMPGQVTFIPVYTMLSKLGLVNTHLGVILQYSASSIPFTTFLMAANCNGIDDALIESAKIDGANIFIVFMRIILPLLSPTIATVAILNFLTYWNELFYAMIILQREPLRTMTVALTSLIGRYASNIPLLYTGLFINCIPVVLIFFVFQKQLIKGVSDGAIK